MHSNLISFREIEIKPGFGKETVIVFAKEGNMCYGYPEADLVVKFEEVINACYRRKGNDLIYTH